MSAEKTAKTTGVKRQAGEKSSAKATEKKVVAKTTKAVRTPIKREAKVEVVAEHVEKPVAEKAVKAVKTVKSGTTLAHGVGRRKASVARVYLKLGSGAITVNGKSSDEYFDTDFTRSAAKAPFVAVPAAVRYDVFANVKGGGLSGQADAVKLGISRALLSADPEIKAVLRTCGLLTVDDRVKERKKYGRKSARRRFQFVKR